MGGKYSGGPDSGNVTRRKSDKDLTSKDLMMHFICFLVLLLDDAPDSIYTMCTYCQRRGQT